MLHIALCEDDQGEARRVLALLERYRSLRPQLPLRLSVFTAGEALLSAVEDDQRFDLLLLDILLPGMDGIELGRHLRALGEQGAIIYLTSSPEFALQAFGVHASHYLLKPAGEADLFPALDRVLLPLADRAGARLLLQTAQGAVQLPLDAIVCVEVTGHVLHYRLSDGQVLASKVLRVPFDQAVAELTAAGFLRPHQSYVINPAHISLFSPREFLLDNGLSVPIARKRFAEVKAAYMGYLARSARGGGDGR